jgi:PAS domain S-box-containing protein
MDLDARLITVNQQFLKTGGYFYDEVIGACTYDFVSGLNAVFLGQKTAKFIKKGKPSGSDYLFRKKDGQTIPLEVSAGLLYDGAGRPMGIIAIGHDVSQRKRDEEQLRFLSSITENTSDAIIVTNADFTITYVNKVAEKFFGYSQEELKGKSPGIFNAEPQADQIQKRLYRIVASGENYLGESLNRRKDGSTFYCEYKVTPLKDNDGKIYAYTSVQRDISERKRNEEVLSRSEDTFRRTFEAIPDPAYVWTRQDDGRVLLSLYNQAAVQITRGGIKNFLGIEAQKLFAGQPDLVTKINRTMEKGQRLSSELLYHYQSTAESKWLQVDYVKTAEQSVMVITKDISERKEAEAKLLAYQEQLRALTSEMVLVEERERRRIASELHDQIGQNLALCKLKVAALEKVPGQDAVREELAVVRRLLECSIQDARSLIFDLSPPVLYELGLAAALEWLAERMQEQFHIPFEFESRFQGVELPYDRQVILFQVVRELLMNAGKHSRASRAKLILAHEGPLLKIQVNDDGVGFDTAKVYAPKEQGSGFGFFSIRERLNYVGGRLEIKSNPGQGSQIILTVPLPAQPIGRRPLVGLPAQPFGRRPPGGRPKKENP